MQPSVNRARPADACRPGPVAARLIADELRHEASKAHRRGVLLAKVADLVDPPRPKPELRYDDERGRR
jgi:hypothetical protein